MAYVNSLPADADALMALPELYSYGREGRWYGLRHFISFMLDGIYQVSFQIQSNADSSKLLLCSLLYYFSL